jgi:hypothetical protein
MRFTIVAAMSGGAPDELGNPACTGVACLGFH